MGFVFFLLILTSLISLDNSFKLSVSISTRRRDIHHNVPHLATIEQPPEILISRDHTTFSPLSFDIIYEALHTYKSIYNSTDIPFNFTMSISNHRQSKRNNKKINSSVKLGSTLHSIRLGLIPLSQAQKKQVTELGYSIKKSEYSFELFLRAWQHFVVLKGRNNQVPIVPRSFVVPNSTLEWPEEAWGMNLGRKVQCIRAGQIFTSETHKRRLIEVDFIWSPVDVAADQLQRSLKAYFDLNGHMDIQKNFIIPFNDPSYDQGMSSMI